MEAHAPQVKDASDGGAGTVTVRNLSEEPEAGSEGSAAAGDGKESRPAVSASSSSTDSKARRSSGRIAFVTEHPLLFGYVCFRQQKDDNISRG